MSRANTDLQQIQAFVVMIPLTISNGVTVLAVTVILFFTDPVLTLLALGSLPFLNVLATRFSRRLHPAVMGIQQESAELAAVVEETVAGVRVVKGFGAEPVQAARLQATADAVYGRSMEAARVRATFLPALELLPNIGLIATLGYGGHQVLDGNLTLGELVAFNVYVVMLIWPLRMLGHDHRPGPAVGGRRRAGRRDPRHRARDRRLARPGSPLPAAGPDGGRGEVRFEGVRFAYAPELPIVLDGFDLAVPAGQSVALVGATGSGKTTVARLIPRFYDVQAGAGPRRRRRRARRARPGAAQGRRHRVRGHVPVLRQHRRQHRLRRPRRPARGDRARRPPGGRRRVHRARCPRATTRRSASGASRSRAGSASASPSPGRSSPTPGC